MKDVFICLFFILLKNKVISIIKEVVIIIVIHIHCLFVHCKKKERVACYDFRFVLKMRVMKRNQSKTKGVQNESTPSVLLSDNASLISIFLFVYLSISFHLIFSLYIYLFLLYSFSIILKFSRKKNNDYIQVIFDLKGMDHVSHLF